MGLFRQRLVVLEASRSGIQKDAWRFNLLFELFNYFQCMIFN